MNVFFWEVTTFTMTFNSFERESEKKIITNHRGMQQKSVLKI